MSVSNNLNNQKTPEITWSAQDADIISNGIIAEARRKEKQKSSNDPERQKDLCLERIKNILRDDSEPPFLPCPNKTSESFPVRRSSKLATQRPSRPGGPVIRELDQLFDGSSFTGKLIKSGGPRALLRYLNRPQKYSIAKVSATWIFPSSVNLHGQLGYHACIRLPGNRLSELEKVKDRSWQELAPRLAEEEVRYASGKQIENMWRRDRELIPLYRKWGTRGTQEGWRNYRFYTNDCFTYVNRVLRDSGQPETHLERTSPGTFADKMVQISTLLTPSAPALSPDSSQTNNSRAILLKPSRED